MSACLKKSSSWMPSAVQAGVEYQIEDNFLRARRWANGRLQESSWVAWDLTTDETVRKAIREMDWELLPKHEFREDDVVVPMPRRKLFDWARSGAAHG